MPRKAPRKVADRKSPPRRPVTPAGNVRRKFTAAKRDAYLKAIAEHGKGRVAAAEEIGMSRGAMNAIMREDPEFAQAVLDAEQTKAENVLDAVYRAALGYSYREDRLSAQGNVFSVELLAHPNMKACEMILYNVLKNRFQSASRVELTGKDGGPVELEFGWGEEEVARSDAE